MGLSGTGPAGPAGLAGLVIEAGRVMIVERDKTLQAVEDEGLFLTARVL